MAYHAETSSTFEVSAALVMLTALTMLLSSPFIDANAVPFPLPFPDAVEAEASAVALSEGSIELRNIVVPAGAVVDVAATMTTTV